MNQCCKLCQQLHKASPPHSELQLLSEVTGSQIFKCLNCNTYMHFVLGVWEVFMANSPRQRQLPVSPSVKLANTNSQSAQRMTG